MKKGEFHTGASTCFTEVVKYCNDKVSKEEVDMVLIFTDGESSCSQRELDRFKETGIQMHRIYMQDNSYYKEGHEIRSNLDELPGNSYTLILPKVES